MKDYTDTPLNQFVRCASCGSAFSGYMKTKRLKTRLLFFYYYKCNKTGCKCNRKADKFHSDFRELLKKYTISPVMVAPLIDELEATFIEMNRGNSEATALINKQLKEIDKKLEILEEKFIYEGVDKELYLKHRRKLEDERQLVEQKLKGGGF